MSVASSKKGARMNTKSSILASTVMCAACALGIMVCSQPTKPPAKPRLAPIADVSAYADDTVRLSATVVLAPDTVSGFIWSFCGSDGRCDTTRANSISRVWNAAQAGVCTASVKVYDGRGVVSDPVRFRVTVSVCRPALSITGDTLVDFSVPGSFSARYAPPCSHLRFFVWSFDGGLTFPETSFTNSITKRWSRSDTGKSPVMVVMAQVAPGQYSDPAFLRIHIVCCRPAVSLSGDSVAYLAQPTRFSIANLSPCPAACYLWSFNGGDSFSDTTFGPSMLKEWQIRDTGVRIVRAAAQTASGIQSPIASMRITVAAGGFTVSLPRDTAVSANDTVVIAAQSVPDHSTISEYIWSIDQSAQTILTKSNILAYCWTAGQAGPHLVAVRAVDGKGRFANSNTMTVTVRAVTVVIDAPHDTLVRSKDTVVAAVSASSGGGKIIRYYWNVGGLSWTDSTDTPQRKIWRQVKDTAAVMVGARDEHGNLGIDSFHVFFNAPPSGLEMFSPKNLDTVCLRTIDGSFASGIVSFAFAASDKNGPSDSLMFRLSLGKSPTALSKIYEGRAAACVSSKLDTAQHFWSLVVKDRIGDSASLSGSFACVLQQTICFAGHSIIVGLGCDRDSGGAGGTGGIRKKILSTLRAKRQGAAKVKAIGPLPTGFLTDKKDDSCLAVSSYRAKDVFLLMRNNFPALSADLWVLMLGVNDSYSRAELQNLMSIVDLIYTNNPLAFTYIINGLPFTQAYGQDTVFNKWLADSVRVKKAANRKIWNIDAYKKFAAGGGPVADLFIAGEIPPIHPNQRGYDTLSQMILDTINRYP
jgi:hypothetical protein